VSFHVLPPPSQPFSVLSDQLERRCTAERERERERERESEKEKKGHQSRDMSLKQL